MNKHKLTLLGGSHGELRVRADILHETLGALLEGARHATRFFVEGESSRKGPRPGWLDSACRLDIRSLSAGSAALAVEAPTLEEAAPFRFGHEGQGALFDEPEHGVATQTAVDLFGTVLASVLEGQTDEVMADRALLDTCVRFARAAGDGSDGIRLEGLSGRAEAVTVRLDDVPRLEMLRDETPEPQAVRVCGVLDTISASRSDVLIRLSDGSKVPARLEEHDAETLQRLFDRRVVISGVAQYRPSGKLLLVDAESLSEAREADEFFETVPVARARLSVVPSKKQEGAAGVAAFFGTWPGDESDEELLEALRAIG